jgi:hypothetical protein
VDEGAGERQDEASVSWVHSLHVMCNDEHTTYNLCVVRYHVPISDGAISSAMLLIREPEIGKMKLVLHSWVQILHHAMCNMYR